MIVWSSKQSFLTEFNRLFFFVLLIIIIFNKNNKVTFQMKKKKTQNDQKDRIQAEQKPKKYLQTQQSEKIDTADSIPNRKTISCQQILQRSTRIVNDNFTSTIHPKRTSMNLSSFVHVFRKKVRQNTIAKQFQNSLEKFDTHSQNRSISITRQKGGFVGSFRKQNQLLIENNRFDVKIKKIIISDSQYKDKKINPRINYGQELIERLSTQKQFFNEESKQSKQLNLSRRRLFTYSNSQHNQSDSQQSCLYKGKFMVEQFGQNPQMGGSDSKLYDLQEKYKSRYGDENRGMGLRRRGLQKLNLYQRPNLMYNLSLYRKKNSYNVLRKTQKRNSTTHKSTLPER